MWSATLSRVGERAPGIHYCYTNQSSLTPFAPPLAGERDGGRDIGGQTTVSRSDNAIARLAAPILGRLKHNINNWQMLIGHGVQSSRVSVFLRAPFRIRLFRSCQVGRPDS